MRESKRKGPMRYLSNEPLKLPVKMTTTGTKGTEDVQDMSLPEVLRLCARYEPVPGKFALTQAQLRSLNKGLDVIEGEPDDGYYLLDNDEIATFKVLLDQWAPLAFVSHTRNIPNLIDALTAAPEKKPEKAGASDNGVVKEATKVAQEA